MKKGIILGMTILIALSAIGIGVYAAAVSSATFTGSPSTTFETKEVFVYMTAKAYVGPVGGSGATQKGSTYTAYSYNTGTNVPSGSLSAWTIPSAALAVDSDNDVLTLEFAIRNDGPDTIKVTFTRPVTISNCTITGGYGVAIGASSNAAGTVAASDTTTIANGATTTFRYNIRITDNGSFTNFGLSIVKN